MNFKLFQRSDDDERHSQQVISGRHNRTQSKPAWHHCGCELLSRVTHPEEKIRRKELFN